MADRKYPGINNLDISLVARLVLENLITRLLKGKSDEYLVTAHNLADEYGVEREEVQIAILELISRGIAHGLPKDYDDIGKPPTGVRLRKLEIDFDILVKDEQPRLGDDGDGEPMATPRPMPSWSATRAASSNSRSRTSRTPSTMGR